MKKMIGIWVTCILLSACSIPKQITNKTKEPQEDFIESVGQLIPNTYEFEYGSLIKINELFQNNNMKFIDEYLDTAFIGEKTVAIKYEQDTQLFKEEYTYNVVDTTKPLIWLSGSYSVTEGFDGDLTKKIICADNHDKSPNCYIEGQYDVNTPGSYRLTYNAEDDYGNTESIDFTLYVKRKNNVSSSNSSSTNRVRTKITDVIKKYKNEKTMIGIDVSKYQGDIDWAKVKAAGVEFAMIRLGTQWYFGEEYIIDPYYEKNIQGALANDIKVGIYFYSYATDANEGKKQAQYVLDNIKNYEVTFPIAFDWESFNAWNELGISLFDLQSAANAFQDEIKNAGYTPIHYGSKNYLNAFWQPIKYDTWLAHYTINQSDYDKDYIMWQLCNNGLVDGINGDVDINVYYK
ncbi:MAG: hypothetical protein E7164_03915 [Firmicutes bacterium]|nr:hypothetical protein [Bacillota bacterium]